MPAVEPAESAVPVAATIDEPVELLEWSWRIYLIGLTTRMVLLFCLYTLSIGPMYWSWYSGKFVNGSRWIAAFYEPLWILAHWFPWLGAWIDGYVRLWNG